MPTPEEINFQLLTLLTKVLERAKAFISAEKSDEYARRVTNMLTLIDDVEQERGTSQDDIYERENQTLMAEIRIISDEIDKIMYS